MGLNTFDSLERIESSNKIIVSPEDQKFLREKGIVVETIQVSDEREFLALKTNNDYVFRFDPILEDIDFYSKFYHYEKFGYDPDKTNSYYDVSRYGSIKIDKVPDALGRYKVSLYDKKGNNLGNEYLCKAGTDRGSRQRIDDILNGGGDFIKEFISKNEDFFQFIRVNYMSEYIDDQKLAIIKEGVRDFLLQKGLKVKNGFQIGTESTYSRIPRFTIDGKQFDPPRNYGKVSLYSGGKIEQDIDFQRAVEHGGLQDAATKLKESELQINMKNTIRDILNDPIYSTIIDKNSIRLSYIESDGKFEVEFWNRYRGPSAIFSIKNGYVFNSNYSPHFYTLDEWCRHILGELNSHKR